MPRRNRRYRKKPYYPPEREGAAPNYEAIARSLVLAGLCSPLILERPLSPHEGKPA
jgi:hypothetical protein